MNEKIEEILDFKEDADYKRLSVDEIKLLRYYITKLLNKIEDYELYDNQEIERLNKGLEYIELYWSNREEYEKNELLKQIRDKDTSIEWLERAIEEEKKRERLY